MDNRHFRNRDLFYNPHLGDNVIIYTIDKHIMATFKAEHFLGRSFGDELLPNGAKDKKNRRIPL